MEKLSDLKIIPLEDILKAQQIALPEILNTPMVKLNVDIPNKEIYLKLENLQPVGSFKIRGAYNALKNLDKNATENGVYTSSAGNFAQGLAWSAKKAGVKCDIICPLTTPQVKIDGIKRLNGNVIQTSHEEWWNIMMSGKREGTEGTFIHPCCDFNVMAGNGVIGLEILKEEPDLDTVICSYGGGGHSIGISSALRQTNPDVKVFACEVETAAPLFESLQAKQPVLVQNFQRSFVDGMNGQSMFPCMWNLATALLKNSIVLSVKEICNALKIIAIKNKLLTEGAAAATVAAALTDQIPDGKIVCVLSGGNIDTSKLTTILNGGIPYV